MEKSQNLYKVICKAKNKFFIFEYSGHGKSDGKFTEGNISKWTNESKQLIKAKLKKK